MAAEKLIIFLKAPHPGSVKTRLAKTMGADAACNVYRRLVEILLANLSTLPHVELRYVPDGAEAEIQPWLRPGWQSCAQGEGDLGRRLETAFTQAFSCGSEKIVVIGSDCPAISVKDIREAWAELKTHDLVLGPATDGGYWLVGLRGPEPTIFEGITWSSDNVLAETLQRAKQANLKTRLLRILADVDTEKDWREFLASYE